MSLLLPEVAESREKRKMKQTQKGPMLCDKQSKWGREEKKEKEGRRRELRSGLV